MTSVNEWSVPRFCKPENVMPISFIWSKMTTTSYPTTTLTNTLANKIEYPSSQVLYLDHEGNANPLSTTFLPTAARHLSSSSFPLDFGNNTDGSMNCSRRKEKYSCSSSATTEVEATYCPQCLAFYDPSSAAQYQGVCPRAQCRLCPVCVNPLSMNAYVGHDENRNQAKCVYQCNYCRWNSTECGIVATVEFTNPDDVTIDASIVSKLSSELSDIIIQREIKHENKTTFDSLVREWGKIANTSKKSKLVGGGSTSKSLRGVWSLEELETSLADRAKALRSPITETPHKSNILSTQDHLCVDKSQTIPLRMPLRSKKSRRCKLELKSGRPGILVKAKGNPLEGDSSLRSGHGQWWKKDSSAIHMFPNISVFSFKADPIDNKKDHVKLAMLLKVQNPTLGILRIRFGSSEGYSTYVEPRMNNILLDPYQRLYVDASTIDIPKDDICLQNFTDVAELEPSEDILLDIGKSGENEDIDEVLSWDASTVLSSMNSSKISLLSHKKDVAWFELLFVDARLSEIDHHQEYAVTMPIGIQIQVGEGSWESSLIKVNRPNEELDFVQFWTRVVLKLK